MAPGIIEIKAAPFHFAGVGSVQGQPWVTVFKFSIQTQQFKPIQTQIRHSIKQPRLLGTVSL